MADSALKLKEDGSYETVYAKDITEADRGCNFICNGTDEDTGIACKAPVFPKFVSSTGKFYFGVHRKSRPHIPFCSNNHSRKTIDVKILDRSAHNTSDVEIYQNIYSYREKERSKRNKRNPDDKLDYDEQDLDSSDYIQADDEKKIRQKLRNPQTIREYIALLESLSTTDTYANRLVFDLILDERTLEQYARMGIPCGRPFVVTAKRTFPYNHDIQIGPSQWLLVDYWANGRRKDYPIRFLLNVTPDAQKKLVNLCRNEPFSKIFVYAIFKEYDRKRRIYESNLVMPHMIDGILTESHDDE